MFPIEEAVEVPWLVYVSVFAGVVGIGLAWYMYVVELDVPARITKAFGALYTLVYNKYFIDEVYDATIVHPLVEGSRSVLWRGVDQGFIDGIVNGVGHESRAVGGVLRSIQSGNIRTYATWVVLGSVAVVLALGLAGGIGR
jgi:NADH-quinone oxidoreductase subunit L